MLGKVSSDQRDFSFMEGSSLSRVWARGGEDLSDRHTLLLPNACFLSSWLIQTLDFLYWSSPPPGCVSHLSTGLVRYKNVASISYIVKLWLGYLCFGVGLHFLCSFFWIFSANYLLLWLNSSKMEICWNHKLQHGIPLTLWTWIITFHLFFLFWSVI